MKSQERSMQLFQRGRKVTPGGVSSPVRSFRSVGGNPFAVEKADGPYIYDLDGNRFIDLVCSWGALIHGHNHPRIREAIQKSLEKGTSFGITCEKEIELCELITECIPSVEMIRLVNSGTEACMSAIRLARGATGRNIIIKFDGTYHGHADSFLVSAGSGLATLQVSDSAGVTSHTLQDTQVLPFNDEKALENIFEKHGQQIAAVIVEPVCGNMGVVMPKPEFLTALRQITQKYKSILIFDEVMTGFRLSLRGSQGVYAITPDLVCLGKIIGGGLPVGAYGGRKDLMSLVAPLGPVYQAGTLSGNPLGASAGIASVQILRENEKHIYKALDSSASELKSRIESHSRFKNYPVSVAQAGSMLTVFFCPEIPRNHAEVKKSDTTSFQKFFSALLKRGIYYPPSAFEACFLSSAHTDEVMNEVADAMIAALDEVFLNAR